MTDDRLSDTFDRVLAGHPVPAGAAPLAAFADGVRAVAVRPGRPSPQLAELLADGLLTTPDGPLTTTVRTPGVARPIARRRRRRTVLGILTAAAVKLASAGAVAQAATGLGIALAAVTGAGAAGVLPDPVQDRVSGILEAVTPFDLPDPAADRSAVDEKPAPQEEVTTGTGGGAQDGEPPAEHPAQSEFGRQVSDEAQDGGADGDDVSDEARATHRPGVPPAPAPQQPGTEQPAPGSTVPGQRGTPPPAPVDAPVAPRSPAEERPDTEPGRP